MSIEALQDYTFISKSARYDKSKRRRETWAEATDRVKQMHLRKYPHMVEEIEWAFQQVLEKRCLGSQRALQFGGKPIEDKNARIYNCTASYCDRIRFFQECFWLLLCGCGTGFSVQRHHIAKLPKFARNPHLVRKDKIHIVDDSIEGWADALGVLLATYFYHPEFENWLTYNVVFDYSEIRPEGADLASGVGKAPGPEPLRKALAKVRHLLDDLLAKGFTRLRPIDAYDITMHFSDAVLSGGVRRSAALCLFSADDTQLAGAKTGNWRQENPQRGRSNNSALLIRGETTKEQFAALMEFVQEYGEPGFIWADSTESIFNPCVEIGMRAINDLNGESGWQGCNLCEINGKMIRSKIDFVKAATAAAIIGTLQAGYTDFPYLGKNSEEIFKREALLGVSITGIMDSPDIIFDAQLQRDMAELVLAVNAEIAAKIGINPAARATCVKPAGTTSCILGTASGVHYHHAKRYFRRVQGNVLENPSQHYKKFNPLAVEKSVWSANGTDEIITFCVEPPKEAGVKNDADAVTFLSKVKFVQENWVAAGKREEACVKPWLSHNVSNTVIVQKHEWPAIVDYIYDNRQSFAGISFMPASGDLDYPQAPMCEVHNASEIAEIYGEGSMFASGLIVDGLRAFNDNLWVACDAVNGLGEPIKLLGVTDEEFLIARDKKDWIRRAKQFADRYFGGDIKKMSHCLKEVHNWKLWQDLQREHKPVDFTTMIEETDETQLQQDWACSGGACEVR